MKNNEVRVHPQSTFKSSGLDVEMQYGDYQTNGNIFLRHDWQ